MRCEQHKFYTCSVEFVALSKGVQNSRAWKGTILLLCSPKIARQFFRMNTNSTIIMYSSRAFIWMVTPLGFICKKMNSYDLYHIHFTSLHLNGRTIRFLLTISFFKCWVHNSVLGFIRLIPVLKNICREYSSYRAQLIKGKLLLISYEQLW